MVRLEYMLKKINVNIIIALCTSFAMIAFAFYERYGGSRTPPELVFYIAAAAICLLSAVYAYSRRRVCRKAH